MPLVLYGGTGLFRAYYAMAEGQRGRGAEEKINKNIFILTKA